MRAVTRKVFTGVPRLASIDRRQSFVLSINSISRGTLRSTSPVLDGTACTNNKCQCQPGAPRQGGASLPTDLLCILLHVGGQLAVMLRH